MIDTGSDDDDQAAILSGEQEMVGTLVAMDFPLYEASNVHWFKGSVTCAHPCASSRATDTTRYSRRVCFPRAEHSPLSPGPRVAYRLEPL